jgi:DNA-binding response OmpR family regulator
MVCALLAFNDTEMLMALSARLSAAGWDVVAARDGFRALEAVHTTPVDLVLSEIRLPELDGHHLCFEIKHDPVLRDVPVAIVTRETDPVQHEKARMLGADAVVVKPPDWAALDATIRELASRPAA